jgi:predicted transcriptional regulator
LSSGELTSKPDLYVIARVIKALKEKNRMNKTALATATGLAYDKLVKYLAWMSEKGFVTFDENGLVVLTKAGSEAYDELVQWIIKYVGQLKFPRLRLRT